MNEQKMCDPENEPRYQLCKVCGAKDCDCTIKDLRNFQAGAASRDAEIQRLQFALADAESLELGTAERCDQLRAQINVLRDALAAMLERFEIHSDSCIKQASTAIASTTEQSLAEYRNKVIEAFVNEFSRHVGGDGEFWLHELKEFAMKEQP